MIKRMVFILGVVVSITCLQFSAQAAPKHASAKAASDAANHKIDASSVKGNPISRHDDYTINSTRLGAAHVKCLFTNTGANPVRLDIWTRPDQKKPVKSIQLKAATQSDPIAKSVVISAAMHPHWWCRIYKPDPSSKDYRYCSYFSVSDATIVDYVPFSNFDKIIHSKDATYSCSFVEANNTVKATTSAFRFFYFK